jgi:hypothetical protein
MDAITKPSENTFALMSEHPNARSTGRSLTWVFLAGTVSALITGVLQAILQLAGVTAQTPGLADLFGSAERGVAFSLGVAVCSSPIAGGVAVLIFVMAFGIVQWVATMFGGSGTFSRLAYTMAAISIPLSLIASVLAPFGSIRFINIITGFLSVIIFIYSVVLELMAIKGVNKFGWLQAFGSLFLPGLALLCCMAIPAIAVLRLLGPAIGDTFSAINSTLP